MLTFDPAVLAGSHEQPVLCVDREPNRFIDVALATGNMNQQPRARSFARPSSPR